MTRKAKRESSAFPDLPLSPVFAAEGVTFQEIFAAFMVSFRLKIQGIVHISFTEGPENWSLLNPPLTSGN